MSERTECGNQAGAAERQPSVRREFWARVYVIAWGSLIAMGLGLGLVLLFVFYRFLATTGPTIPRVWAIIATVMVPIGILVGLTIGVSLADRRIEWHSQDTDRAMGALGRALYTAAVQASDVRVYGFNQLFRREATAAQEMDLGFQPVPPGDDRGVTGLPSGNVIDV